MTENKSADINTEYCIVRPKIIKKILFCDDSKLIRDCVRPHLSAYGIDFAECLEDVIDKLKNPNEYKVVISDVNLPDGEGLKIIEDIRKVYEGTFYLVSILKCDDQSLKRQAIIHKVNRVFFDGIGDDIRNLIEEIQKLFNSQDNSK